MAVVGQDRVVTICTRLHRIRLYQSDMIVQVPEYYHTPEPLTSSFLPPLAAQALASATETPPASCLCQVPPAPKLLISSVHSSIR